MSISHRVLPAALVTFRKKHPKMHVQIREDLTSAVHEDVRSGIADFGIGNAIDLAEGVVAESIVHEACYVVMPKRHRLGALSFVSFKARGFGIATHARCRCERAWRRIQPQYHHQPVHFPV
jgi:LysR family carnitine catabolism transcriptional activator